MELLRKLSREPAVCNPDRNGRILNSDQSGRTSALRFKVLPFRRTSGVRQVNVLSELKVGETGILVALDLPESVQNHLMHMGFVPDARVTALRRAPGFLGELPGRHHARIEPGELGQTTGELGLAGGEQRRADRNRAARRGHGDCLIEHDACARCVGQIGNAGPRGRRTVLDHPVNEIEDTGRTRAEVVEDVEDEAVIFRQQAEQEVLGAHILVVAPVRLVARSPSAS